jgi:hypothetical protein
MDTNMTTITTQIEHAMTDAVAALAVAPFKKAKKAKAIEAKGAFGAQVKALQAQAKADKAAAKRAAKALTKAKTAAAVSKSSFGKLAETGPDARLNRALNLQIVVGANHNTAKLASAERRGAEFEQTLNLIDWHRTNGVFGKGKNADVKLQVETLRERFIAAGRTKKNVKTLLDTVRNARVMKLAKQAESFDGLVALFVQHDVKSFNDIAKIANPPAELGDDMIELATKILHDLGVKEPDEKMITPIARAIQKAIS